MGKSFQTMLVVLIVSCLIMLLKASAWLLTGSVAILSDALESIVNIVAQGFALFSIYFASKPKDRDHPYGHGKIESFSVAFEGSLIFIAGLLILIKSSIHLFQEHNIHEVDMGIYLTTAATFINLFLARWLINVGKQQQSAPLLADAKHLISDVISSGVMIAGLLVIYFTKWYWLDGLLGLIAALFILRMGLKLLKSAAANLLDEADEQALESVIRVLSENRKENWIDIHKLRTQRFGRGIHIDAHITLPYYLDVKKAHHEIDEVEALMKQQIGEDTELFLHIDPCTPDSCPLCSKQHCEVRSSAFRQLQPWKLSNLVPNRKHSI
jgi:cation diffusion facilitator family transporter